MEKRVVCSRCRQKVEEVCANCWCCKDCNIDCVEHMKRTINGHVGSKNKEEKI